MMKKLKIGLGAVLLLAGSSFMVSACHKTEKAPANSQQEAALPAAIPAPNGSSWTDVVSVSPEGGFVMGNPKAPVSLVEYASFTCPHCADFTQEGFPKLRDNYIAKGLVKLEFRNLVRDPFDIALTLLARCRGAETFFPIADQLFQEQKPMFERIQNADKADLQRVAGLPQDQQMAEYIRLTGMNPFFGNRGLPTSAQNKCLTDQAAIKTLMDIRSIADKQNVTGTPMFLINGTLQEVGIGSPIWDQLEPALKAALQ
ncbi:protein-disulfide isomerase-like protein [Zymomonas mobilis subsp. mobilis ZM4 = ATCC 31821]|uniref:Protein-disulfide isomerase-like protein n=1 Tax=Zymomonas mobilis subsp. mobilis (strain ATCC 31821 / ZM4 / CP4) TaxID=264203 RepID=Q5NLW1_ZYMMO|nr:thioredoxin domain-containing protein [Zymomonas mobilis]AAV90299.1 protein-disulfide isomerase-like protein [Zymomonas mobilis subsp. mobilis ZM4 = ATCC 31821]AVZ26494.1 protein-disulfide isomerase-like protein [Zymomonas mobilis subsp. mobilis]AVZ28380.1 protein-disulfide isomerase-like protein [Zymomonas mobilis subsp. mobilis]AVZ42826.1 protein-disulfide isomerase-like protein [Zymomonas mobilis subsp. mobilis ZM4 = ATCC 31821]UBQ07585.1 thioredoxin domain-containing protein [Zymomonas 